MPCSLYCFGQFSLMTGTNTSSFFCPDFGQTRNKPCQEAYILKVNFLDVALTKKTRHFKAEGRGHQFPLLQSPGFLLSP